MSGIPAASGYPQYSGGLIEPIITQQFMDNFNCHLNVLDFTSGEYLGVLAQCGDTVSIRTKSIAKVRPLEKNGKMVDNYLDGHRKHLTVGKALYDSLKIDKMDEKMICDSQMHIGHYLEDVSDQFMRGMELDTLSTIICGVDPLNQGKCAGAESRCYNLGALGDPLCFGKDNADAIFEWLCDIYATLMESCTVTPGHGYDISGPGNSGSDPFIIIPIPLYNAMKLAYSVNGNCCLASDNTPITSGRLPERVGNFHIFVSNMVPYYMENGERTYMIPAGRRDAASFVMMMEETRKVQDTCSWGHKYQAMVAFGSAMIYPEAMTLSRVKVKKGS